MRLPIRSCSGSAMKTRSASLMSGNPNGSHGLEDYDLWCRFAELGLEGVFVPELICEYRVHAASMVRTRSIPNILALNAELALRHPSIFYPHGAESAAATGTRRATEGAGRSDRSGQRQ